MGAQWSKSVIFDLNTLKQTNPVPELVKNLLSIMPANIVESEINTILTELYNNSLDHGLLGLSSDIKQEQNGLEKFYNIRKEKLNNLTSGSIEFNFIYYFINKLLIIEVNDSGSGFNYLKYLQQPLMLHKLSGKGLYILNRISNKVEFEGSGNKIKVYYTARQIERTSHEIFNDHNSSSTSFSATDSSK